MQTQTPTLTLTSLSHLCAKYLQTRFLIELKGSPSPPICASIAPPAQPLLLPIALASELDRIAVALAGAWLNPVEIDWDAACYANRLPKKPASFKTQTSKKREAALMERYPPNDVTKITMISRPCIIQDKHGVVLTWYLPEILNDSRRDEMMAATEKLYSLLTMDGTSGKNWRNDPKNYYPGDKMPSGSINISPAWFQQAHETVQEHPQVSASLNTLAGLEWLDKISTSNMILSAILAVIHPELYEAGRETFKRLRENDGFRHQDVHCVLDRWTSVFSGLAVISNRVSPIHRDGGSRCNWYDLLVTLGSYQDCNLELPGLGISLDYPPGTVVGLSGAVVQHAVHERKKDRMCYAYFMRDSVHEWAGVPGHRWMETKCYE